MVIKKIYIYLKILAHILFYDQDFNSLYSLLWIDILNMINILYDYMDPSWKIKNINEKFGID